MGYEAEILQKVLDVMIQHIPFSDIKMLEFGNQEVYSHHSKVINIFNKYNFKHSSFIMKYFYEHLGMSHTSIDYNGKDGALSLDVREDISTIIDKKFNYITNIGFSEHVGENDIEDNLLKNQYSFFKNMHDLGDDNCIYYHCVPLERYWYKHGVCDYTLSFFKNLCDACGYKIINGPFIEDYHPEKQASIFFKKIDTKPFITYEQFTLLGGIRSTYRD
jgi:hypothetical protein